MYNLTQWERIKRVDSKCDRDPQGNMSFVKKRRLVLAALVVVVCVSLGTVLMIRASGPVETIIVYTVPKPNPARAELLARALQPKRHPYATKASNQAPVHNTGEESFASSSSESLSHDAEFDDTEFEAMLMELEAGATEENRDFPPVPDGFPSHLIPVWLRISGYKKGDQLDRELTSRVLIKLWNRGDRDFVGGVLRGNDRKVYPLYPVVLYVDWKETVLDNWNGNPINVRYISGSIGTHAREFDASDFISGDWEAMYPDTKFVPFNDAGYDPYTFLTEDD